jgi:hypothetical protein
LLSRVSAYFAQSSAMPRFSLWLLLKMQVYTSRHYLAPYAPALDSAAHMFLLSRAAADAVVSCFGVNALVQNKSLHDSMMMVCFGDRETPSLFDAVIECATRILKSLGWEAGADASSACSATIYETLYMLSNNHLMSALNNCAAVVAWMCETIDGAAFVAPARRSRGPQIRQPRSSFVQRLPPVGAGHFGAATGAVCTAGVS